MKHADSSFKVGRGWANLHSRDLWVEGEVSTPDGFVTVYSQDNDPHTRLDFIYYGRQHIRTFKATFTKRGLAMKARHFARDIVENYGAKK